MPNEPDFHDGYVDGVLVSGKNANLFVRTNGGQKFTIVLREVFTMTMNDFRSGNIILSLDWIDPSQISDEGICNYWQKPIHEYSDELRDRFLRLIGGKQLQGLDVSPSYGASLTAVFKEREMRAGYPGER